MKLLEILEKRTSNNDYDKDVVSWLNDEAKDIIRDASAHLEYVRNVLVEFDLHNVKHSEAVLKIIEDLLGDHANNLSSYDLFSLIAVSYLHDCGMAVSDFEINVMRLIENDEYDGKKVCTKNQALALIEKNKAIVFKSKNDSKDVKGWLFYPGSEEKLFDYYSQLLIDYQSFRNGKIDRINKSDDIEKTNNELRTDYIRRTHAERVETYIKTWGETRFSSFPNKSLGKRLANKIAITCRAHGETDEYVRGELEKKVMYVGNETSNLQFVAMMLRIGDIVHFSYDRAPIELRAMHHFESDYSHEQWRIKSDSGVNYSISKNGEISYSAYCIIPQDYYDLMKYVDGIDNELVLYNRLRNEEQWEDTYPALKKYKVNRDNIAHDDSFTPVPNLKFTLEQNRILELLMGAQLYSDKYACLRELYQNSLDACRCQMAADEANGKESVGKIEFGIETDKEGKKYVYCLDNGKGMSTHIIENYLLKIGSSYYKSSDFYQSQAATGNKFTPTSQFGIGILSCFMIGDRLEITTKEEGGEYISCVMENIHECFYYKKESSSEDIELIPSSGTLIKIFLNDGYKDSMSVEYMDNIGYLLWSTRRPQWMSWDDHVYSNHLYFILDNFVKVVPANIELNIKMSGDKKLQIFNKPILMGEGTFAFPENVEKNERTEKAITSLNNNKYYKLDAEYDGIQCSTFFEMQTKESNLIGNLTIDNEVVCVDGIRVGIKYDYYTAYHGSSMVELLLDSLNVLLNFTGSERPQLNISRDSIENESLQKYDGKLEILLSILIKQAIDTTIKYLSDNHVEPDSDQYISIWEGFFHRFQHVPISIYAQHFTIEPIKDYLLPLPKNLISSKMTFGEFFAENVCFERYYRVCFEKEPLFRSIDPNPFLSLIDNRIGCSKEMLGDENSVSLKGYRKGLTRKSSEAIPVDWRIFDDYDLVSYLKPFVSQRFYEWLNQNRHRATISEYFYFDYPLYYAIKDFRTLSGGMWKEYLSKNKNAFSECGFIQKLCVLISEFLNANRVLFVQKMDAMFLEEKEVLTLYSAIPEEHYKNTATLQGLKLSSHTIEDAIEEGLSVILFRTGDGTTDFYVIPGRWSRQELMNKIPDDIWNNLNLDEYHFIDGSELKRSQKE